MNHLNSHLGRVIDAFNILVPKEPLDAKTLSELIDLTPKQTSQCLSILHRTGYLAKVGSYYSRAFTPICVSMETRIERMKSADWRLAQVSFGMTCSSRMMPEMVASDSSLSLSMTNPPNSAFFLSNMLTLMTAGESCSIARRFHGKHNAPFSHWHRPGHD